MPKLNIREEVWRRPAVRYPAGSGDHRRAVAVHIPNPNIREEIWRRPAVRYPAGSGDRHRAGGLEETCGQIPGGVGRPPPSRGGGDLRSAIGGVGRPPPSCGVHIPNPRVREEIWRRPAVRYPAGSGDHRRAERREPRQRSGQFGSMWHWGFQRFLKRVNFSPNLNRTRQ